MSDYSIKQLEQWSGIKAHTLRIWEKRFQFLHPRRNATNLRFYTLEEMELILSIGLLTNYGYRISQIASLSVTEMGTLMKGLPGGDGHFEKSVNDLLLHMVQGHNEALMQQVQDNIAAYGISDTVHKILIPFSQRAGYTGHREKRSGRASDQLIRQYLRYCFLAALHTPSESKRATVLLFLPGILTGELNVLETGCLLKAAGYSVIYSGPDTSLPVLKTLVTEEQPLFVFTQLTTASHKFDTEDFLGFLDEQSFNTQLVILQVKPFEKQGQRHKKLRLLKHVNELVEAE